jgi:hypothetical protein
VSLTSPVCSASTSAVRTAADRRGLRPASTPIVSPSCRPTAGVTALPAGASSARTQKVRRRSASAPAAALTAGSSVQATTYQAPSRSPSR